MKYIYYRLKSLVNDKVMLFWTLLFPLILSLLFQALLKDVYDTNKFQTIPVGIIETKAYQEDTQFQMILELMQDEYELIIMTLSSDQAELRHMLENNEIVAIIEKGEEIKLIVDSNSIEVTIVSAIMDSYIQQSSTITRLIEKSDSIPLEELLKNIDFSNSYFGETEQWKYSLYVIHIYTVLAMVCLFGAHWGVKSTEYLQANLSPVGIRINLAPISKLRLILTDVSLVFVCTSVENIVLFGFLKYILKVDFGQHTALIIAVTIAGSLLSISLGYLAGVVMKANKGMREMVVTATTLIFSFLSGMQRAEIKYFIERNLPILAYLNPAALITDSYYVTYYYSDVSKVYTNIALLLTYAVIASFIAYRRVRKLSYDSI